MKLVIGNKNYSSWSLRPWIAMKQIGLTFEEALIPMAMPGTRAEMLRYAPTGLVPVLIDGEALVFETIAILEYLNDKYPEARLWPKDLAARAHARSIAAEMHGGFAALRRDCPMNIRRPVRRHIVSPEAAKQAERIDALWSDARARFGEGGPFLFGHFTNPDAMYAPVVNRFHTYDLPRSATAQAYMDAMMALPAWKEWEAASRAESWVIASSEIG
ncbi:MAG: glutathione S-transferase family protein [Methylocystis sp.]|nr:glutathione S-transferase family protein [Methylocystis sp.]MCA3588575.1 glutathione S-transferase family protein [Methylocystis sp.]MCA3591356.1 glutathione S-transferase family protein [Methylocystis sp.]